MRIKDILIDCKGDIKLAEKIINETKEKKTTKNRGDKKWAELVVWI